MEIQKGRRFAWCLPKCPGSEQEQKQRPPDYRLKLSPVEGEARQSGNPVAQMGRQQSEEEPDRESYLSSSVTPRMLPVSSGALGHQVHLRWLLLLVPL